MKVAKQLNKDSQSCLFVSSSVTTESRELESSTITSRQFVVVGNVTAISGLTSASNTNFISVLGNRSWHLTEETQCKQIRVNFTEIRLSCRNPLCNAASCIKHVHLMAALTF